MLQRDLFSALDNSKKIQIVNYLMDLQKGETVVEAKNFLEELKRRISGSEESDVEFKKSISNIIIYLLTKISDPKNLEDYLMEKEQSKHIDFDVNFALLLCQQSGKKHLVRSEIILYG